jgi:hypothetical protein
VQISTLNAIPEPSSLLLLGSGSTLVVLWQCRRRGVRRQ